MSQTHKVRPNVPKCCPIPIYTVCPVQPLTQTLKGDVSSVCEGPGLTAWGGDTGIGPKNMSMFVSLQAFCTVNWGAGVGNWVLIHRNIPVIMWKRQTWSRLCFTVKTASRCCWAWACVCTRKYKIRASILKCAATLQCFVLLSASHASSLPGFTSTPAPLEILFKLLIIQAWGIL